MADKEKKVKKPKKEKKPKESGVEAVIPVPPVTPEAPREVAVAKPEQAVARRTGDWNPSEIELIKNTVAKGATNDELKLFLYTAKKSGLDPFSRQIFFVKRKNKNRDGSYSEVATIQTGIDGYRAIAERTGELAGIDDPTYVEDEKGGYPKMATAIVYRMVDKGGGMKERVGFAASARWSEYAPDMTYGGFMWKKMPFLMLGKCAEALALRKAFPHDLSGIYTTEEMAQADKPTANVPSLPADHSYVPDSQENRSEEKVINLDEPPFPDAPKKPEPPKAPSASDQRKIKIFTLCKELGVDTSSRATVAKAILELTGFELEEWNYQGIIDRLTVLTEGAK